MIEFLSDEWFVEARRRADAVLERRPGVDCGLQFEAGPHRWFQEIREGTLTRWEPGDLTGADLTLRLSPTHAFEVVHRRLDGTAALSATTVVVAGGARPPSPIDVADQAALAALERIPGADLDVQYEYADGPFGPVSYTTSFRDGLVASMTLGHLAEPDVVIEVPYSVIAPVRSGRMSVYAALEQGRAKGDVGPLATLAGLLESPAYHAAELACDASAATVLARLGQATAGAGFQEAMKELGAVTAAR